MIFCFSAVFLFLFGAKAGAQIIINEIMYDLEGADSGREWVEIYNNSVSPVDLTGWKFNDSSNHILNIPPQNGGQGLIVMPADSYAIISDNAATFLSEHLGFSGAVIDSSFSLKNTSSTLKIINKDGNIVDNVFYDSSFGANGNGKTLERQPDGSFKESQNTGGTPGTLNSQYFLPQNTPSPEPSLTPTPTPILSPLPTPIISSTPLFSPTSPTSPTPQTFPTSPTSQTFPTSLIITEFIPSPEGSDEEEEWIEIYNEGNNEINLKNWRIRDLSGKEFVFKEDKLIGAAEYLVLPRSLTKITLNNDGESLSLIAPTGENVFKISYQGKATEGLSFARFGEGKWAWTANPTPGKENVLAEKNENSDAAVNDKNGGKPAREETLIDLSAQNNVLKAENETEQQKTTGLFGMGPWSIALFISIAFAALSAVFIRKIGF